MKIVSSFEHLSWCYLENSSNQKQFFIVLIKKTMISLTNQSGSIWVEGRRNVPFSC